MKVCHVTSVHHSRDTRIAIKECPSLAAAGYDTYLVAKGESREDRGVHVIGVGSEPKSRILRMLFLSKKVFKKSIELDCDVYHLHDPELLKYVRKYKKYGKKVIFDSHEDVPAQIEDKYWIPKRLRGFVAKVYQMFETKAVGRVDAVVTATSYIAKKFERRTGKIVVVNNYPKLEDIQFQDTPFSERDSIICYAGGINKMRGEEIMLEAMKEIDGVLILAGNRQELSLERVNYAGYLNREEINELYGKAVAGLVLLLPTKNYFESKPIKMYEYMAAGLPFVASDFPAWRKVVDKWKCGICVSVNDIESVRSAITTLLNDRELAQEMGRRGREAVEKEYCWKWEEKKLYDLYKELEHESTAL